MFGSHKKDPGSGDVWAVCGGKQELSDLIDRQRSYRPLFQSVLLVLAVGFLAICKRNSHSLRDLMELKHKVCQLLAACPRIRVHESNCVERRERRLVLVCIRHRVWFVT